MNLSRTSRRNTQQWSNRRAWTPEETKKLVDLWPTTTANKLAEVLNRTKSAICTKIYKDLKISNVHKPRMMMRKPWCIEDENLLRNLYKTAPARAIAQQLGIDLSEVRDRARLLGLKSLPREKKSRTLYYYDGAPKFFINAGGCWEWQAGKNKKGYGTCRGEYSRLAHRQMYFEHFGEISKDKEVDHKCRNRSCVNPSHLEAVTHVVNIRRGAKSRKADQR